MKIYPSTTLVLAMLLASPKDAMYPRQISKATGLSSGTVAPILRRLADHGWCTSRWEDAPDGAASLGRPLRRYYLLTATGAYLAEGVLKKKLGSPGR